MILVNVMLYLSTPLAPAPPFRSTLRHTPFKRCPLKQHLLPTSERLQALLVLALGRHVERRALGQVRLVDVGPPLEGMEQ